MAIPAGYTELGRIGFVDRGNYSADATYRSGDVTYHNGSTWVALKDNLKGVTPTNGASWKYMARGFAAENLAEVTAKDTSGVLGTAGASVTSQALVDAIADKVMTKLFAKANVVNNLLTTEAGYALDARQGKALKTEIDKANSDLDIVGSYYTANINYTKTAAADESVVTLSVPRGTYIVMGYFRCDAVMTTPKGWWCRVTGGDNVGSNAGLNIAALGCSGIAQNVTTVYGNVIGLAAGDVITGSIKAIRIK